MYIECLYQRLSTTCTSFNRKIGPFCQIIFSGMDAGGMWAIETKNFWPKLLKKFFFYFRTVFNLNETWIFYLLLND